MGGDNRDRPQNGLNGSSGTGSATERGRTGRQRDTSVPGTSQGSSRGWRPTRLLPRPGDGNKTPAREKPRVVLPRALAAQGSGGGWGGK